MIVFAKAAQLARTKPQELLEGACPERLQRLDATERRVLSLVATGSRDKDIAQRLAARPGTVSSFVSRTIDKAGPSTTRTGLIALALRHQLLDLPLPDHPGPLSDEVMALLWALAGNKTLGQFTSDHVGLRDWDTSRISLFMRDELEATTNAHALYLAWPVLCEEANWP